MTTLWLAFNKEKGDWVRSIIRWKTKSPYSHVELVLYRNGCECVCFSSSGRQKPTGVRVVEKRLGVDMWDFLPLHLSDKDADSIRMNAYRMGRLGLKFNWWDIIKRLFGGSHRHGNRLSCVVAISYALSYGGIFISGQHSPGSLYKLMKSLPNSFTLEDVLGSTNATTKLYTSNSRS